MNYPNYGDERLTKDGRGYVNWHYTSVDHYSHDGVEQELESVSELISRGKHLETLGIPANTDSAVWNYWRFRWRD
jgi:hypothetical protein